MKKKFDNNWIAIKEEFEIAGIVFPKGATGICTYEGNVGFLVMFDTFKTDERDEKSWVTLTNDYQKYFEVLEVLDKPWYEISAFNGKDKNKM